VESGELLGLRFIFAQRTDRFTRCALGSAVQERRGLQGGNDPSITQLSCRVDRRRLNPKQRISKQLAE